MKKLLIVLLILLLAGFAFADDRNRSPAVQGGAGVESDPYAVKKDGSVALTSDWTAGQAIVSDFYNLGKSGHNVLAYGVTGDGATDDLALIQSTIDAVGNAGGGTVIFPKGVYRITDSIVLRSNVVIRGIGNRSVIKLSDDAAPTFTAFKTPIDDPTQIFTNITLRDFALDGNNSIRTDASSPVSLINMSNCDNVVIDNLHIFDGVQGGIAIQYDNASMQRFCTNVKITNCTIEDVGIQEHYVPEGIVISAGENILIDGCTIRNVGNLYGINAEASPYGIKNLNITNNYFFNCDDGAIQIRSGAGGGYTDLFENIVITGNIINASYLGINAVHQSNHVYKDMIISNNIIDAGVNLYRGRTDTNVGTQEFCYTIDDGTRSNYGKAAVSSGTALPAGNIPANTWGIYLLEIGADGTIDVTGDTNSGSGYATEALAIAARPAESALHQEMGYVTVQADAGVQFIPGTDALMGGTSGTPAQSTRYYSLPLSETFGVYASNAIITGNLVKGFAIGIRGLSACDITNNQIRHCGYGLDIYASNSTYPPHTPASFGYIIANNRISDVYDTVLPYGIYFSSNYAARAIVTGNLIEDTIPSPTMTYGIYVHASNVDAEIILRNNRVYGYITGEYSVDDDLFFYNEEPGMKFSSSIIEKAVVETMSASRTFKTTEGNYFLLDADGSNRNFNPTGSETWQVGASVTICNTSSGGEIIYFDAAGLNSVIAQDNIGVFIYNGASWVKLSVIDGAGNMSTSLTIGDNSDADFSITFDSDTSDGVINYDEDNSEFEFDQDIVVTGEIVDSNEDWIQHSDFSPTGDGSSNSVSCNRYADGTNRRMYNRTLGGADTQDMDWYTEKAVVKTPTSLTLYTRASDYTNCAMTIQVWDVSGNADATGSVTITPTANDTWEQFTYTFTSAYTNDEELWIKIAITSLDTADTIDFGRIKVNY